jgi:hypothetical protein
MAAAKKPEPEVHVHDMSKLRGTLKAIGGSMSDDWNNILANQTVQTLWVKNSAPEEIRRQRRAAVDALIGMAPRDEFEGMIAAQLTRESQPGEQALADIHDVTGIPQSPSRQRRAESHGRARSRSRGRTSHRRQRREPGRRVRTEIRGSTPCTCTCTGHHDAEHGHDAGARASRRL